jgi:hypothetical protein
MADSGRFGRKLSHPHDAVVCAQNLCLSVLSTVVPTQMTPSGKGPDVMQPVYFKGNNTLWYRCARLNVVRAIAGHSFAACACLCDAHVRCMPAIARH